MTCRWYHTPVKGGVHEVGEIKIWSASQKRVLHPTVLHAKSKIKPKDLFNEIIIYFSLLVLFFLKKWDRKTIYLLASPIRNPSIHICFPTGIQVSFPKTEIFFLCGLRKGTSAWFFFLVCKSSNHTRGGNFNSSLLRPHHFSQ